MDEKKTMQVTTLTRKAYSKAIDTITSAKEAAMYLENDLITRNVRSIIEKFSGGRDLKRLQNILVDGLLEHHSDMKKDSVSRRVRGWLSETSTHSIRKEDAIEIAFILQLDLEEADEFVSLISEEKLHWRSVDEMVFIYGLEHGLSYCDCVSILQDPNIQEAKSVTEEDFGKNEIEEYNYTEFIRDDVEKIDTVEELISYIKENASGFGVLHNTAYKLFMEMIGKLESPSQMEEDLYLDDIPDTRLKYTVRDILEDYFYQEIVLTAKNKAVKAKKQEKKKMISKEQQYTLNIIQKKITDSWPDEVSISKMKSRKMDVTRKILILLFLATDGDYEEDGYDYDLTEEEVFEDIQERLNNMLIFCGYSLLDPRNPFDWLIIYCICVDDLFDIDSKMNDILDELFSEQE